MPPKTEWIYIDRPNGKREVLVPKPKADEGLFSVIRAHLEKEPDNLCILEEQLEDAGSYLNNPPPSGYIGGGSILTYKNDLYFFHHGVKTCDEIRKAISYASSILICIGVLTSFPGGGNLLAQHKEITDNQLRTLAENTESIFVGAYDGVGYLIWHKK